MTTLEELRDRWEGTAGTTDRFGRILRLSTSMIVGKKKTTISVIRFSDSIGVYVNAAHIVDLPEERAVPFVVTLTELFESVR